MIEIIPNWHPVFVHFTVGLLVIASLLFLASKLITNWRMEDQLIATAYWNLWIGVVIAVITVVTGWIAFNSVEHDDPSHLAMLEHRSWALATAGIFVVLFVWSIIQYKQKKAPTGVFVISMLVGGFMVIGTGWHGGELVFRHGLGVMSLPDTDDHGHSSGGGHSHDQGDPAGGGHGHDDLGAAGDHHDAAAADAHSHDEGTADSHHHDGGAVDDHHHDSLSAVTPVADESQADVVVTPAAESLPAEDAPSAVATPVAADATGTTAADESAAFESNAMAADTVPVPESQDGHEGSGASHSH